jgi:hypothetical protein
MKNLIIALFVFVALSVASFAASATGTVTVTVSYIPLTITTDIGNVDVSVLTNDNVTLTTSNILQWTFNGSDGVPVPVGTITETAPITGVHITATPHMPSGLMSGGHAVATLEITNVAADLGVLKGTYISTWTLSATY